MELCALIKEKRVTRVVTSAEIQPIINETVRKAMLLIVDKIIAKNGKDYKVMPEDIYAFHDDAFSNFAIPLLREIISCKREVHFVNYKYFLAENYDRIPAGDLRETVLNYPINIEINNRNFDYILKELGEINTPGIEYEDYQIHKCGDCQNLSPLTCEKAEYYKKTIEKYDFIIDGYQIYYMDENGEVCLDKFIVQKCKCFKREPSSIKYKNKPKEPKRRPVSILDNNIIESVKQTLEIIDVKRDNESNEKSRVKKLEWI